jgi:cytochrome c-type biogenesis protein
MPDAAGPFATVAGGPLLVAMGLSALVGLIGFLSPCVLPLIPGYLSDLAGLSGEERAASQRQMIGGSMLFAAGFTAALVLSADVLFVGLGRTIADHRAGIERTSVV